MTDTRTRLWIGLFALVVFLAGLGAGIVADALAYCSDPKVACAKCPASCPGAGSVAMS